MAADWEQLKAAFAHAADLPAEAQRAYVEDVLARDPALGEELKTLLAHDAQDDEALAQPISRAISEIVELPFKGQSLGPYVIIDTIATGGMGTVFRGRRNDAAFDQDVAIKVMNLAGASEDNLARFRTERQILAQLTHPYIAEIFDGGSTGQGQPYLVMEYIAGMPIDEHCRTQGLDDRARIDLFLKVCDAVSLAHQNLIVHRDIKPSNVLVTATGVPKLLDFGIAKPIGPTRIDLTQPDTRAMTPEYASPEQVRGEPVTTQTDVYALGLLLYRMLSEKMPYATTGLSPAELEKSICNTDPAPLSRSDADASGTSRRLRVQMDFAADLNTIVMCALQKDPQRRYATVTALIDDINRFLHDQPISARPDSAAYRAGLFIKRHRFGASATALILILGLVFTGYTYRQAERLAVEKHTAERAMEYLTGLFRAGSPTVMSADYGIMPDMKVSELLDLGASRIYTDLADQPLVQARLLGELGNVYSDRGNTKKALELLTDANAKLLSLGEEPDRLAESLASAGWMLVEQTRYRAADGVMTSAYDMLVNAGMEDSAAMYKVATDGAVVKARLGEYQQAHELYEKAIYISRKHDIDPTHHAVILHNQSWTYWLERRYAESEAAYLEALRIWQAHLPADHPYLASAYDSGAGLKIGVHGDVDAAEALYLQAMEINSRNLGEQHPEYAHDLLNYALLLQQTGRISEAQAANQKALAIINQYAEADYQYRGTAHAQLADNARLMGNIDKAQHHIDQANAITDQRDTPDTTHSTYLITARLLADQARYEEALALLRQHTPPADDQPAVEHHLELASISIEAATPDSAAAALAMLGEDDKLGWFARKHRNRLVAYLDAGSGNRDSALGALRNNLSELENKLPQTAPEVIEAQLLLARLLMAEQDSSDTNAEAAVLLESAHRGLLASGRENHPLARRTLDTLAQLRR